MTITLSGSVVYNQTQSQIIQDALLLCGAYGTEQSIRPEDIAAVGRSLNRLLKHWENQAMHIWKRSEGTLFLQTNQASYSLGASSTDHACSSTGYVSTTNSSSTASGANTIICTSVTGMTIGDNIGIVLDAGSLYWSTITAINTGTLTVTITGTLTSQASAGAAVYDYTTAINKPLSIVQLRRRDMTASSLQDIEIREYPYADYWKLPTKLTSGDTPAVWSYNRGESIGTLYCWPIPNSVRYTFNFTYFDQIQDLTTQAQNSDIPQEWLDAITYSLAARISPIYGKLGTPEFRDLQALAAQFTAEALQFDNENTSIQLTPDYMSDGF